MLFILLIKGSLSNNSPILQLQWVYTEADSWFIFSGGYGDKSDNSITLQTTQNISLKSFEQPIIQFLCLPSTPFVTGQYISQYTMSVYYIDCQKTFALAVLTQSELVMFDLQTPGCFIINIICLFLVYVGCQIISFLFRLMYI